jgi:hypothetical protein
MVVVVVEGMGGEMGVGVDAVMGGGPDAGGPADDVFYQRAQPVRRRQERSIPDFKIDPQQVLNDIAAGGVWGAPTVGPQMNPFSMYGEQASSFPWNNYFGMFGGK